MIREWWSSDSTERFWLEITDRLNIGGDLLAPKQDQSGTETWSYSLVSRVQRGDVVFHYWKQIGEEPAIVGFSTVAADPASTTMSWQPHGTYAQAETGSRRRAAWIAQLRDYNELPVPVTQTMLRSQEVQLRRIRDNLESRYGAPLYFPFSFSDKRPLRATQGYLTKLPLEVVQQLGLVSRQGEIHDRAFGPSDGTLPTTRRARGAGRQQDPEVRKAVELHAMRLATEYYEAAGCTVKDVSSTHPYDLLVLDGPDELHIEVKGTVGIDAAVIEVTDGEIKEARSSGCGVLFVVDGIGWRRTRGGIATDGGSIRVWEPWSPEAERLSPTVYRYTLPPS